MRKNDGNNDNRRLQSNSNTSDATMEVEGKGMGNGRRLSALIPPSDRESIEPVVDVYIKLMDTDGDDMISLYEFWDFASEGGMDSFAINEILMSVDSNYDGILSREDLT